VLTIMMLNIYTPKIVHLESHGETRYLPMR
jgi:hypothetical protein